MARMDLTALRALGALGSLYTANAADLPTYEADPVIQNQVAHSGKLLIVVHNKGLGAKTVTFPSSTDSNGRTGDITEYSVGVGEYAVFGPFDLDGWVQTGLKLYCDVADFDVYLGVVDLANH